MQFLKHRRTWVVGSVVAYALVALIVVAVRGVSAAQQPTATNLQGVAAVGTPTYSSPIALSDGQSLVWSVNPDDDSVSIINAATDTIVGFQRVGDEPQGIAVDDVNRFAYVVNAADNSVTIIQYTPNLPAGVTTSVLRTITTGAEPWNVVISPDGKRVYVANSAQDTISVLDTTTRTIIGNINLTGTACIDKAGRHFQPRGMAITGDSTLLYVTQFLSFTGGATPQQASDTGKQGVVCRLTINTSAPNAGASGFVRLVLAPSDTGFTAQVGNPPVATPTSAYPNQLQSIVICGDRAYMPNIAASPSGPLRFDVDTHAYLNMLTGVNGATPADAGALNLHKGAEGNPEPKVFFANVWAMACDSATAPTKAYVVSAGSDGLVKINIGAGGAPSFTNGANSTTFIDLNPNNAAQTTTFGLNAGKNPLGIVIRSAAGGQPTKAFVMNFVSRNVSVVNLDNDTVIGAVRTTQLPAPGSRDEELLVGAEIFFSSRGNFDRAQTTIVSTQNRLSQKGWQNCASCHFAGLTDGNIWAFGSGPRKSVPLNATWSPHNPDDQRILNYSAIFDEVEDFEINIRNVSGPGNLPAPVDNSLLNKNQGLLVTDTNDINFAPTVLNSLGVKANAGRPQHTVTLAGSSKAWPALTAMKEWVRFAIRTPNGALTTQELTQGVPALNRLPNIDGVGGLDVNAVRNGRRAFFKAGCASCHGGTKWTISSKDFTSPPAGAEIAVENAGGTTPPAPGTVIGTPYLPRFLKDIGSFNLNVPGKGNLLPGADAIGGFERAAAANVTGDAGPLALGIDHNGDGKGAGYNVPSLLGIWQLQPYYHNGACETLACVLSNQTHAKAGRPNQSNLSAQDQANIVEFLKSLDAETPFPSNLSVRDHDIFTDPPTVFRGTQVQVGVNVSLFGTKPDLANLVQDLGAGATLKVKFSGPGSFNPAEVTLNPADFNQDFGQTVISTTWTVPNDTGALRIRVEVDSGNVLPEDKENDNSADRRVRVLNPPPDTTPPVVGSVAISDDNPFNDNDSITTSRNVKVKFTASDSGQNASGLDSFCIVRYSYDTRLRRWVEEKCDFRRLPTPEAGTSDTFIVETSLRPREGTAYAFVWVKDKDGNISRQPGQDVISFIPAGEIELDRNDVRIFRVTLAPGSQPLKFTFNVEEGDVDVSVFDGINPSAPRIALSANNGDANEEVTIANNTANAKTFQIEVRAIVNSEFRITFGAALATVEEISPAKDLPPSDAQQLLVGGPPAARSAIGEPVDTYLPIVIKP